MSREDTAVEEVRAIRPGLPDAHETLPWEKPKLRVKDKLLCGHDDESYPPGSHGR